MRYVHKSAENKNVFSEEDVFLFSADLCT